MSAVALRRHLTPCRSGISRSCPTRCSRPASPSELLGKVAEYLAAGVKAVCLLEPDDERLTIYTERGPARQLGAHDRFELPAVLGGFSAEVSEFFA